MDCCYASKRYWNERYVATKDEPFDWMCNFAQIERSLASLISPYYGTDNDDDDYEQEPSILIVGCGNAPFSHDMLYEGGYTKTTNIDFSEVVISQQKDKYPEMDWRLMDALDMKEFKDRCFDVVIDKSLVDTTLCYDDGNAATRLLFSELHRVLRPGGRLITISLHEGTEILPLADGIFQCCTCTKIACARPSDVGGDDPKLLFHTFAVLDRTEGLEENDQFEMIERHPLWVEDAVRCSKISKAAAYRPSYKESRNAERNKQSDKVDFFLRTLDSALANSLDEDIHDVAARDIVARVRASVATSC